MPTRRFDANKEQSLAEISAGNAGNGNDLHCPNGKSSYNTSMTNRTLWRFAHDWSDMTKVTKIELFMRKTGGEHTAQGSAARGAVNRCGSTWDAGGGSENVWSTSASGTKYPGPSTGTTSFGSMTGSGWQSISILDSYWGMVPASVAIPAGVGDGGLNGGGEANNGIRVRADSEGTVTESFEVYGLSSSYPPYLIVTYEDNDPPNQPTLVSPIGGVVIRSTDPLEFSWTGSDPDSGDTLSDCGFQIHTTTDFTTPLYSATIVPTAYKSGWVVTDFPYNGPALAPGTYYWRVRNRDQDAANSPYSAAGSFIISSGPSIPTGLTPGSGALADIHNAADLAIWTAAGLHAKPIVKFTYAHTAGRNMQAYRVRMYSDALAVLYDSGTVLRSIAVGAVTTVNVPTAIKGDGTQYRWGVEVQDVDGVWSPAMTPTTFKVRWGQAIYTENITTSGKDFSWNNTTPTLGRVQFLYRLADDAAGTGATPWTTALPSQPSTPKAYLHVLVRLVAVVAGQNPALPDMTLTYGKGTAALPDKWANPNPAAVAISLDSSVRRFGRHSLRVRTLTTGSHYLYPWRASSAAGNGIEVMPDTEYTFSAFVRTNGPLAGGAIVRLGVRNTAHSTYIVTLTPCDPTGAISTNDSSAHPDGWQRLAGWFRVPVGTTQIVPDIWCNSVSVGNEYWVDGVKLEEGRVASTWAPGALGPAAVLDRAGLQIDAKEGGILRLRGSTGGVRDLIELGPAGLKFSDTELASPSTGVLAANGSTLAKLTDIPTVPPSPVLHTGAGLNRPAPVVIQTKRGSGASIAANGSASVTITWPTPFADANYTATFSVGVNGDIAARLLVAGLVTKTAADITIRIANNAGSTALVPTYDAIGIHD